MVRRRSGRESDPILRATRFLILGVIAIAVTLVHAFGLGPVAWGDSGAFEGQVLDMDTQKPIRGAVVLVIRGERPGPGYPITTIHDTDSALTDESGRFHIPGKRFDALPKGAHLTRRESFLRRVMDSWRYRKWKP